MEKEQIISKLKESIKKDFGDQGRTLYIIEKLQKDRPLPNSDSLYIQRMIKLCEPVIEEQKPKIPEIILSRDLIKCNQCDLEIKLDEKSIRKNNFWFHERCFEKIPIIKPEEVTPEIIKKEEIEKPKIIRPIIKQPEFRKPEIIHVKPTYPQMAFSGSLLASLIGTTYFLAGELISTLVGIWGSAAYLIVYQKQIFPKKKLEAGVVKTGIPGFDSISVGLKKSSSVVVSGPPGSGKTTFGLQFIYSGAKDFDEPGVYITLSQSTDEIKENCRSFGWNTDDLIKQGKILMVDLRPFKIKDEVVGRDDTLYRGEKIPFEHLTKFILNSIKKIKAKRIVIDSISILGMQYSDKFYMRQGLQGMIQSLENFDVTSLLISEFSESNQIPLEWFVTSGIIQLDNQISDNQMKRTIKITKLRGVEHSEKVHPLELGSNGLYVFDN